jgi:phosphoadenosine phosphosulfate reductase
MSALASEHERLWLLALQMGGELETATPQEVLRWAHAEFGDQLAITSSMADACLAQMASKVAPGVRVVFLDTGYHFAETLGTRDTVAATLPIDVETVKPAQSVAEQDASHGPRLYERDPDMCCRLRKVLPLNLALDGYTAWASGIRRDESPSRAAVKVVEWDYKRAMVKINPLATWTQEQVDEFMTRHGVLVNPLMSEGYASIGCAPCTRPVAPGEHARAGRWAGFGKVECGLHVELLDAVPSELVGTPA